MAALPLHRQIPFDLYRSRRGRQGGRLFSLRVRDEDSLRFAQRTKPDVGHHKTWNQSQLFESGCKVVYRPSDAKLCRDEIEGSDRDRMYDVQRIRAERLQRFVIESFHTSRTAMKLPVPVVVTVIDEALKFRTQVLRSFIKIDVGPMVWPCLLAPKANALGIDNRTFICDKGSECVHTSLPEVGIFVMELDHPPCRLEPLDAVKREEFFGPILNGTPSEELHVHVEFDSRPRCPDYGLKMPDVGQNQQGLDEQPDSTEKEVQGELFRRRIDERVHRGQQAPVVEFEDRAKADRVSFGHHFWRVWYRNGSLNIFIGQRRVVQHETVFATHGQSPQPALSGLTLPVHYHSCAIVSDLRALDSQYPCRATISVSKEPVTMSREIELLTEIRDLLQVIAEPTLAKRDAQLRSSLRAAVGNSEKRAKAALLMDGTRSQADLVKATGIDQGLLSRFVKSLAESKLISSDQKRPKVLVSVPANFFDEAGNDD